MKTAGDAKKDSMTFITIKSHAENLEGRMGKIHLPIPEGTKRILTNQAKDIESDPVRFVFHQEDNITPCTGRIDVTSLSFF